MTSGEFTHFPVDQIWVDRAKRQRKEITPQAVADLAASIAKTGLIHPPVIQRSGELRVGETRWEAVKTLGWDRMPVQFVEDLDEDELQALELEENIKRTGLPWLDECAAVSKFHDLKVAADSSWTQAQTADILGMNRAQVSQKIGVHKEASAGNKRVLDAPKLSTAINIVSRTNERKAASAIASAMTTLPLGVPLPPKPEVPLLHADFNEWAEQYSGPTFNFLHCDFPYGVNADKHDQGQAKELGGYADGFDVYEKLLNTLGRSMWEGNKLVAESAHLMFWFSMDYYQYTKEALEVMGWKVNPFPLIWYKSDNTGILPDPQRGPRRSYETAFMASRGDRKLTAKGAVSNTCAWPGRDKSIHMSEKPVGMLKHFMGMMVDEHTRMLDPTAGSANSLKAASSLSASSVLGLEYNKEFFDRSVAAYFEKDE